MVVDLSPSSAKSDAPTNPKFADSSISSSTGGGAAIIYTVIAKDHLSTFTPAFLTANRLTVDTNLNTTKGFRIKNYNALTTEGVLINPTDFATYHYYVLIHSDDAKKHHFARITEIKTEDVVGDAFEFEPKLGNEIPKGTEFRVFKGHQKTDTDIVAVSFGIKNDLKSALVCAKPLFYFHKELLDKPDELDHNAKYYCMQTVSAGTTNPSAFNTTNAVVFRTMQDFGKTVIDYSKYSHRVTLTDKLRDLDDIVTEAASITINEGGTITADTNDYNKMFPNARRDSDDLITTRVYTGPTRYLHYSFSPTKANLLYNVYEHYNTESINGKGGFAETIAIDSSRVLPKKIKEFTPYRVRHTIHRGDLDEFKPLKATYSSTNSTNNFNFNTDYNLETVLNAGDEVKIDNTILIVSTFGSLSSGVQSIAFRGEVRTENEGAFATATVSPTAGASLHRRAYNATDGTLMLDISLLNGRFSKMYVSFSSFNNHGRFATITACDGEKGLITLLFDNDSYTPKNYLSGEYFLYIERFNGEIENIGLSKELGQTQITIKGRDKFNKLLSPIINLNTLFTEDIIYSSNSPYNKLSQIDSTTLSIALGATTKATGIAVSAFDIVPTTGDKIFTVNGYIGEITSTSGDPLTINFTAALTQVNSEKIYIDTEKNYILSKALSSSHLTTNKPSSLLGSANKGIIFSSGTKLNADGTDGVNLPKTSLNTIVGAEGYAIKSPSTLLSDNPFQTLLADEHGSSPNADFDVVNTLIDFEVINVTKKDNKNIIEMAPYVPITLGRSVEYNNNVADATITSLGTISAPSTTSGFFKVDNASVYNVKKGDSIYSGTIDEITPVLEYFQGIVRKVDIETVSAGVSATIHLDRNLQGFIAGKTAYLVTKKNHELTVINGAHLWGGKILIQPHPTFISTGLVPINIDNTNGASTMDYNTKYGQPYYRIYDVGFGNFGANIPIIKDDSGSPFHSFNQKGSNYTRLLESFKFKPNTTTENLTSFGKTDSLFRTWPLDYRGITSVLGSNFNESRVHETLPENWSITPTDTIRQNWLLGKSKLQHIDDSALRNFLYITGDLLPYSSLRSDSIMHESGNAMTKSLSKYKMLLLENKNIKDTSIIEGHRIGLSDTNYQTLNFSTEQDLSTLKRFGLMRLTEVCYDFMFNPINPEKPIKKQLSAPQNVTFYAYDIVSLGTISIDDQEITFSSAPSPALSSGDLLYDDKGRLIGVIDSGSGTEYDTDGHAYLTNNGAAVTTAYKVTIKSGTDITLRGRLNNDTLYNLQSGYYHPLKAAVVPSTGNLGKGSSDRVRIFNDDTDVFTANQEVYSPIILAKGAENAMTVIAAAENFTSTVIWDFCQGKDTHAAMIGLILDRFQIENGGKYQVVAGQTTQLFTDGDNEQILSDHAGSSTNKDTHLVLESSSHFKDYANTDSGTSAPSSTSDNPKAADGAYMVFKPRLYVRANTASNLTSSNGNLKLNVIIIDDALGVYDNHFLKHIDLTGCYLASEHGRHTSAFAQTTGSKTVKRSSSEVEPTQLIHVISHEPHPTTTKQHHLITDIELTVGKAYRILQPNETCLYDFMPKKIDMNVMKSSYTKMPNSNKVYDITEGYFFVEGIDGDFADKSYKDEGALSMFVFVDTDKQSTNSDSLVIRDGGTFIDDLSLDDAPVPLFFSDGDNNKKINVTFSRDSLFASMELSDTMNAKGVVSASESFTIESNQELKINPKRACIGATVSVGLEGDDLINELFEQEGIEFEITSNVLAPKYLAPDYQGVDLYSAIRYILEKKDMKLLEENNVFKIVPDNNSENQTNIIIDDSRDFLIYEFEKVSTVFDFYNEIIVYGGAHKSIRKDIRSIQKRGRKTLEVNDKTLMSQEDVNSRALKLLRMHTTLNEKLTFSMESKGISQLRVGDIVGVEINRENIPLSEYIVLEMKHELTGFITLQLGKYHKDLSDIFAELLMANKETKSALRNKDLVSNEQVYNFLEKLKVKQLKLLVRSRNASGGFKFGFGNALNTATTPFGFSEGTITYNTLVEEDVR